MTERPPWWDQASRWVRAAYTLGRLSGRIVLRVLAGLRRVRML